MITYLDRVCVASATNQIGAALELKDPAADLNWAFGAFAFAYAVFEIPSGWLGDVFGPRNVLIRIVLWWSVFTALTGRIGLPFGPIQLGYWWAVTIRFLFGMGEAGAYPNITRALHNWFPFGERGSAQGAVWMSGRLMGGLTPLLWLFLVEGVSDTDGTSFGINSRPVLDWRWTFAAFGVIGALWCIFFGWWFRNLPQQNPSVNEAELELIHKDKSHETGGHAGVPWLKLLSNSNLWCLCLMYSCASYGWYLNITYLPKFMEEQFSVPSQSLIGAIYKGGPLWMGAFACLAGGFLTDRFIRMTGNRKWGRRLFGVLGHALCSICYVACIWAHSAFAFFFAISLAAFFNDLTMGAAWATCQDIGKRYAAIVAGCMNTIGNLGGFVAGVITGKILSLSLNRYVDVHGIQMDLLSKIEKEEVLRLGHQAGYTWSFISFAVAYAVAVLLWLRVDATKPVAGESAG
jgi:MFS family permease